MEGHGVDVIRHFEQGLEDGPDTLHVILRPCLRGPEVAVQERPQMQVQGLWRALGSKLQAPALVPKSRARMSRLRSRSCSRNSSRPMTPERMGSFAHSSRIRSSAQ